ncbi:MULTISPECIES: hypothetical protein [unclassified Sphingobium]|nr:MULTISPECIES: hypothetical protein [unclassified Sphingobium]
MTKGAVPSPNAEERPQLPWDAARLIGCMAHMGRIGKCFSG